MRETCNFSSTCFVTLYSSDKQLVPVPSWGNSFWSYLWQTMIFCSLCSSAEHKYRGLNTYQFSALWYPFHSHFLYKLFYIRCRFRISTACCSFNYSLLLTTCNLVRLFLMFPPDKKTGLFDCWVFYLSHNLLGNQLFMEVREKMLQYLRWFYLIWVTEHHETVSQISSK